MRPAVRAALLLGLALGPPRPAGAAPPPPPAAVSIGVEPVLGPATPTAPGWSIYAVRLHNPGEAAVEGSVELRAHVPYASDERSATSRARFAAAGKATVMLQVPVRSFQAANPEVVARALDARGDELAKVTLPAAPAHEPFLFDLTTPSRVATALRARPVAVNRHRNDARGGYGIPQLSVGAPQSDAATGDPVLPDRAAGYASVTLVLSKSEQLARLQGAQLDALVGWVLAGGALAVVPSRPEDLRGAPLATLVGGPVNEIDPPAALAKEALFETAAPPGSGFGSSYSYAPTPIVPKMLAPTKVTVETLRGWSGGNLKTSPWGASASYGLGEIHLLAFDATRAPTIDDEWTRHQVLDLVQHAWNRSLHVAFPQGAPALDDANATSVRRALDPNQGTRWAVAVSALLLLVYAMLAGPLNFHLASRHHKPLRALRHLPFWAAGTFALIVALGALAKGVRGRARHLTLVEAGAGMGRAQATRFRAFFASSADTLTVRGSEWGSVLDVSGDDYDVSRTLVVDRDGPRLERFHAKPWQTVVVREDGFVSLAGGVSIARRADGEVTVKNRLARDLIGVVVKAPRENARYFSRLKDGQSVVASAGKNLGASLGTPSRGGSGVSFAPLLPGDFAERCEEDSRGLGKAWEAIGAAASADTDWWPADVPVLVGQLEGGEGRGADSGMRLESDRVLVRVVGWGGAP